jgi:hypothetical protein
VLTRLTTLELGFGDEGLETKDALLLIVRLAALGSRLVSVCASQHSRSEGPLKGLPGGGLRLDLSYVGFDDSCVDERD